MQEETWKPSVEFPNNYWVSNLGNIKNKKGHILVQALHRTLYRRVRLCVLYQKYSRSVHRMVAEAFLENPENKPEVNHKDGNKSNNHVENLEWVSKTENMSHAVTAGKIDNPFGREARNSKYVTKVFDLAGNLVHTTYGNQELKDLGFDYRNVHAVITGRQKTHRNHYFTRELKSKD